MNEQNNSRMNWAENLPKQSGLSAKLWNGRCHLENWHQTRIMGIIPQQRH